MNDSLELTATIACFWTSYLGVEITSKDVILLQMLAAIASKNDDALNDMTMLLAQLEG